MVTNRTRTPAFRSALSSRMLWSWGTTGRRHLQGIGRTEDSRPTLVMPVDSGSTGLCHNVLADSSSPDAVKLLGMTGPRNDGLAANIAWS
jgi:hypothetical protein